jgi:virginiamycin B lyase
MRPLISWQSALAWLAIAVVGPVAAAATLTGTVATVDGRPIAGAMVTAFNEAGNRKETVYTGADGGYALRTSFNGKLALRARTPYFKDVQRTVDAVEGQSLSVDFAALKLSSPEEFSDSLPASAHAAMLEFPNRSVKEG